MLYTNPVNPVLKEFAERIINDVNALTPELSKQGINYDHVDIKSLIETANLYVVLTQVLHELRQMNQREHLKDFPASMLNLNK
jgi:hypothetical protein